ncbi:hypothetical protein BC831DRAFT_458289 [Entophlyctis helioformis]|nr:hypothetical protein BC831DRAFT_458289 [Entophlyctis helioformis]
MDPKTDDEPAVLRMPPMTADRNDDLPDPTEPTTATSEPRGMDRLTSSSLNGSCSLVLSSSSSSWSSSSFFSTCSQAKDEEGRAVCHGSAKRRTRLLDRERRYKDVARNKFAKTDNLLSASTRDGLEEHVFSGLVLDDLDAVQELAQTLGALVQTNHDSAIRAGDERSQSKLEERQSEVDAGRDPDGIAQNASKEVDCKGNLDRVHDELEDAVANAGNSRNVRAENRVDHASGERLASLGRQTQSLDVDGVGGD